ncbi:MAG: BamA/TamA family outer membrane protein [Gammaproteobacteria bacterium]|nr:BamA/TamA family outer membrane protein [Gammaproteobacteria bacterium]
MACAAVKLVNHFSGVTGDVLKNVEARLAINEKDAGQLTVSEIKMLYKRAPREIDAAVQPFGYFRAKVRSRLAYSNGQWVATYNIHLGRPLHITSVDVKLSGESLRDHKFRKYMAAFPLRRGDVFLASKYKSAKKRLFDLAATRGYLAARMVKSQVQIDLKRYTCAIIWRFDSGPRYSFGNVYFGKTPLSEQFLRKFLTFKTGEYYSEHKLQKTTQHYNDSDLFYSVVASPDYKSAKNLHVPIHFHLMPRWSKQYAIGAGFGTDTGPRGMLGFTMRNFNKTGHRLSLVLKGSMKDLNFEGHYLIPGGNPATDLWDISAVTQYQDLKPGKSYTIKAGPAYITQIWGWKQTAGLHLQREWYKPEGSNKTSSSTLLIPSIGWLRSKGNDHIRPTRGYRINIQLQGAVQGALSNSSFFQPRIDAKTLFTLSNRLMFVLRGTLGTTQGNNLNSLPLTLRFTAGGAQSVRGYGYQGIGPGDELAVASSELRFRVYKQWYAAGFFDVGNASDSLTSKFHQGAGVGVVWLSPLGAIELTWGWALNSPNSPWRIQFSMGPEL